MRTEDELQRKIQLLVEEHELKEMCLSWADCDRLGGAIDALLWALGEEREL